MAILIEIPPDLEQSLRLQAGDLDRAAKEVVLVDLYRQRRLTHAQLARALGLSRLETDAALQRHAVYLEMTAEDVARESDGLRELRSADGDRR